MVDVAAVRLHPDLDDLRAQFPKSFGGHLVSRPVGAIDDDAQAGQLEVLGQRALGELDVALLGAFHPLRPSDAVGGGEHLARIAVDQPLDLQFHLVGELVAVGIEQLDAVVLVLVVRG